MFKNARYADRDHKTIIAERADGATLSVPADPANTDFGMLTRGDERTGISPMAIADYNPPKPEAGDVRAEAGQRMRLLLGARDATHLAIVISNRNRKAIQLLLKSKNKWTKSEAARMAKFERLDAAIEAIRAVSSVLEASPPTDYHDDKYWP